ncbi:MAG: TIGR04002 family protein [Lachnospiraceae bacterium]|nr:TIGR04002 family protein [Robinsoniella sp.]MDY3765176.1 TIGR04002 family protein [Lachnospiraceae bacterium]
MTDLSAQRTKAESSVTVRRMTVAAILAAMTTLMTAYIFHIPVGANGGYVHLGDAVIYIAAALLPMPYACAVGAIGGGLADLLTAPMWAPATVIIKMLICLPFSSKGKKIVTKRNVIALFLAFCISATGYYLAEGILFGFTVSFFTSVSGSIVQSGGSAIVFVLLGLALDRAGLKQNVAKGL